MKAYERPVVANFVVTRNCNIDCVFCGVEHMSNHRGPDADLDTARRVVDELQRAGVLRINYFGGEPLFYRGFLDLAEYVRTKGFFTSIVTNGRLITRDNVSRLSELINAWGVSLHGMSNFHDKITRRRGAFWDTVTKIRLLREHVSQMTVNMTVTETDYTEIPALIEFMYSECGVDSFSLNRCIGRVPENLPQEFVPGDVSVSSHSLVKSLYLIDDVCTRHPDVDVQYAIHFPYCIVPERRLLKYVGSCGVGTSYFGVDTLGNVQFCSYTTGVIGNLFTTDLVDIWSKAREYVEFRQEDWMPEACRACEHKLTCMSGCKVSRGTGTFAPDMLLESVGR